MWELVASGNTMAQVRKKLQLRNIYLDKDTISKIVQEAIEEPAIPVELVRTQKPAVQEWIMSKRPDLRETLLGAPAGKTPQQSLGARGEGPGEQQVGAASVKAKSLEEHHRWLRGLAAGLVDRMEALDDSTKPQRFSVELKHEGGKPIWRPRVEGLPYLEAHLESCPLLLQALREIEWLAGDFISGNTKRVGEISKQLEGYDDLLLEESQWRRGLRPSFLMMVSKLAEEKAKERERGRKNLSHVIEVETGQGLKRLIVRRTTIALSESEAELWEWVHLFHSLVDRAAESAGLLLRLRQRLHDEVKAFSEQMEPMRIAGFFQGSCPACRTLLH